METFAWLTQNTVLPSADLLLATGRGYVTMDGAGAYASVPQLRSQTVPGSLISATALVSLTDGAQRRFVMLQRDQGAKIEPGKWQFPAGRSTPDELPFMTACRKLTQEVGIEGGDWRDAQLAVVGPEVDYLTEDAVDSFRAPYVFVENTLEFYCPMSLSVRSFDDVQVFDKEHYGRKVALLTMDEIAQLDAAGQLTPPAHQIFQRESARVQR